MYGLNVLLKKDSLSASVSIDAMFGTLTYPQHSLREFFWIRRRRPFPKDFNDSIISKPIYEVMDNVLDKFVLSWHSDITPSKKFPNAVRKELTYVVHQAYGRMKLIDKFELIQFVLDIVLVRIQEVAQNTSPDLTQISHAATERRPKEQYIRAICDLLLNVLMRPLSFQCEAIRPVLREILSTVVLTPIVEDMTEPSFIYKILLDLIEDDEELVISEEDLEFMQSKRESQGRGFDILAEEPEEEPEEKQAFIRPGHFDQDQRGNRFRIPKVRLFGEGLKRFAVYVIEYSTKLWEDDNTQSREDIQLHLVGRRFKEFAALHDRLLKFAETKIIVKNITFPSKEAFSSFPFNRLDKDFLSGRRDLLTQYMNELSKYTAVVESPDFREFLGFEKDKLTEFGARRNSFAETKIGGKLSKVFQKISSTFERATSSFDKQDFPDMEGEKYASYKETSKKQKKLHTLSRDHYNYLNAPCSADINKLLDAHLKKKQAEIPVITDPIYCVEPSYQPMSVAECRFTPTILSIIQKLFWRTGNLLGKTGLARMISAIFRLPFNRFIMNKVNQLTSELYWFIYISKLNKIVFEEDDKEGEEEEEKITRDQFIDRVLAKYNYKVLKRCELRTAVEVFADALSDKITNQSILFFVADHVLPMFVPELDGRLKTPYITPI
eukprot:sb/3462775/